MPKELFFHSPFSHRNIETLRDRALLLCFALSEIFNCLDLSQKSWGQYPNSASKVEDRPLNRLQEHIDLLLISIPSEKSRLHAFKKSLLRLIFYSSNKVPMATSALRELIDLIEHILFICKEDPHLIFFLLSHQKPFTKIAGPNYLHSLFSSWYPSGLQSLESQLCDHFHKKGFTRLLPEVTMYVQELITPTP